jgi:hypothetical protein
MRPCQTKVTLRRIFSDKRAVLKGMVAWADTTNNMKIIHRIYIDKKSNAFLSGKFAGEIKIYLYYGFWLNVTNKKWHVVKFCPVAITHQNMSLNGKATFRQTENTTGSRTYVAANQSLRRLQPQFRSVPGARISVPCSNVCVCERHSPDVISNCHSSPFGICTRTHCMVCCVLALSPNIWAGREMYARRSRGEGGSRFTFC